MAQDLIVVDEDYNFAAKELQEYCTFLKKAAGDYRDIMDRIIRDAVKDELIANGLINIHFRITPIADEIDAIGAALSADATSFVGEIDAADDLIY